MHWDAFGDTAGAGEGESDGDRVTLTVAAAVVGVRALRPLFGPCASYTKQHVLVFSNSLCIHGIFSTCNGVSATRGPTAALGSVFLEGSCKGWRTMLLCSGHII